MHRVPDFPSRADWDVALTATVASYAPDLVVCAGFMKLLGPASSPSSPAGPSTPTRRCRRRSRACTGPPRRWSTACKVTGCTLFVVDDGVDTGPIVEQRAVRVEDDDTVETLHERIKTEERRMLVEAVGRMAREGFAVEGRRVRIGG